MVFLGFMLIHHGIKENPEKCRVINEMRSWENTKEIQKLIGRFIQIFTRISRKD